MAALPVNKKKGHLQIREQANYRQEASQQLNRDEMEALRKGGMCSKEQKYQKGAYKT